jgi:peptidoglycan/LPS O-acetylase OafA/YrhL
VNLTDSNPLRYRAYIDGLRAVAVLAVLFFHADIGCRGGYVGVDVFFVISGYLITGLILKDLDRGQFQVLKFWERRVRRILPAVAVVLLACLAAGWFLFFPLNFRELGQSVVAQAMLVSNVYFWRESGYFAQAAEVKPLLHTWSLAVEEQFYLLYPFLLIAIKRFSRKSLVPAILLLCGVSFSLSVYCSYWYPSGNFYFLPTRAWELLLGSFLAALPAQRASPRWLTESLSWGGLLMILCAVFCYGRETRFPGVAAILPCVGTALMVWANGHTLTSVGKLLAARPVVFIGLISYSLYLWHWPVLVFSNYWALGPIPPSQRMLLLLASMALAVLSWRFVETPFRKRTILKSRVQIFSFASITTAVLLFAGLAIHKTQGVPSRIPAEALRYAAGSTDRAFIKELGLKEALAGDFIELGTGDKHLPIDLLVWGDSHAMAAMPVLDVLCKEHSIRGVAATHSSTAPLVGYERQWKGSLNEKSIAFNNAVVAFIRSQRVGDVVLVAAWGSGYGSDDGGTARLRRSLLDTISALKGTGARIWIMSQVPYHRWNVPHALVSAVLRGRDPEQLGLPLAEHHEACRLQDPIFEGVSAPGVTVLDPTDLFVSSNNLCRVAEGGKALYCDKQHLTVAGAMLLRPLFEPIFAGIGKSTAHARGRSLRRLP